MLTSTATWHTTFALLIFVKNAVTAGSTCATIKHKFWQSKNSSFYKLTNIYITYSYNRHFSEDPTLSTNTPIETVLIVGGGTAGWMTAAYLQKAFGSHIKITLVESPVIRKIGVGEATIPNLQQVFFNFLGIPEDEWMKEVNASFKTSIKFVNWRKKTPSEADNHFYHSFGILPKIDGIPLPQYWFYDTKGQGKAVDYSCYVGVPTMDAKRSPRFFDGSKALNYAWHFDAHLVADFLTRWSTTRGVQHIIDDVEQVKLDNHGNIASIGLTNGKSLQADLFIDCTGFRSLLLGKTLKEPFMDMGDQLLCDSAVACAIPHDDEQNGIEPFTSAIAMKYGWTWKTPMLSRFGTGYVYSSHFVSEDQATDEFCKLWKLNVNEVNLNKIRFRTGRSRRSWVKNCVGIGLSSCFLEPMESTGIYFITAAIYQLAKHFPTKAFNSTLADNFNREIEFMYDDCRDFVQAHYFHSDRDDSKFWLANKNELKLSESMKEKIILYKSGIPINPPTTSDEDYYGSFETEFRNFWTNSNYYCIFSGMGFNPDQPYSRLQYQPESLRKAQQLMADIKQQQQMLVNTLPSHYEYLKQLHADKNSSSLSPALNISWKV